MNNHACRIATATTTTISATTSIVTNNSIDKLYCPSRELIETYIIKSKPFIITGIVNTWSCSEKWRSNDYLLNKLGDKEIPVREIGYDVGEWLGRTATIKFSNFWDDWRKNMELPQQLNSPKYYLASLPINKYFKEIESDYIVPEIPREQNKSANLWIGSKGQITPLHHDWSTGDPGMDGFHAIISGKKLFKLYDPFTNGKYIKRKNEWGLFHHAKIVDVENPDYEKFPEFRNAMALDVVLEQGEMLFIPKLWWHYVKTLEPSISLNFWFQHMGSERLKCNRYWGHIQDYLESVYSMQIGEEKMASLLQYFGELSGKKKWTKEEINEYILNPIKFIQMPKFINSFANAVNNPHFKNLPDSIEFQKEITLKVKQWVDIKSKSINSIL
eukprot:gene8281-10175_t